MLPAEYPGHAFSGASPVPGFEMSPRVVVADKAPLSGPLQVIIGEHTHAVSEAVADRIFVEVD